MKLTQDAAAETDATKKSAMYVEYQKAIIDQANLLVLFQPVYQFAVRRRDQVLPADRGGLGGGVVPDEPIGGRHAGHG